MRVLTPAPRVLVPADECGLLDDVRVHVESKFFTEPGIDQVTFVRVQRDDELLALYTKAWRRIGDEEYAPSCWYDVVGDKYISDEDERSHVLEELLPGDYNVA